MPGFQPGLSAISGEFVIDFATDDVLLPHRVEHQVAAFRQAGPQCGMVYSDAELINEQGQLVRRHFRRTAQGLEPRPASGWVFADVLARYFISTPTMTMRRATLEQLGGYDETLAYEDFDFWVRASRHWQFYFQDEVTTQKRLHPQSMSRKGYRPHDPYLNSTIKVCRKALAMCRDEAERAALAVRVRWELRQAVRWRNHPEARELYRLLQKLGHLQPLDKLLGLWVRMR
ncbi:hypothetical protein [Hymenobacter sp. 5414T-23]|uniref:hypothetical protein n=1 Tax=Hymenobacter sp. 5414T-23 TaxID=2932252 RepID=UPI001FD3877C|nr:hypothetical protein [Hymenobacter sp. 5414T-23]UOQ82126.1 hypothetical protein MUN83_04935 [Hymenobacter sp. 5414T-23]